MLKDIQVTGNKDTRSGFGDGILEAARKNPNIVALTADLAGSLKLNGFIKEFPERFVQCGIAEANMIGIAAGLTIGGSLGAALLAHYGYDASLPAQNSATIEGIKTAVSVFASLPFFIAVACMFFYAINKPLETKIEAELNERRKLAGK